ncbi:MAG TPA: MupA/Atu3671 family FMN-dependent luciferase-like monooxygenase [Candidatus Sulfotelmatobacter sp.]|nr:MupA/Atu3671 family FMN-dependent luciferase-like monooxygenase [Candidatus Sulfotelmatobacter sp.]
MSNLSERIRNLKPEQQELLRRRMQRDPNTQQSADRAANTLASVSRQGAKKVDFSIFFFSADGNAGEEERYRLLLESARFADAQGFAAIWTPERHFQAFGGLYPNPSVLSAALAMITENVQIRAGSLVLPLHSPVRVAEDWALIDNLSRGRVGISFATGWHEHDYVIAPQNYEDRRELMFKNISLVRQLWAGEAVEFPGVGGRKVAVKTLPRPVQKDLPFWVTVASARTWQRAGEVGANVLTAFSISLEELQQNIATYRRARMEHGHDPRTGIVSLMLHTYIGTDLEQVRAIVRDPLKSYLQTYINQFRPMVGDNVVDPSSLEMQSLLDAVFEHYFEQNSLLGTPEKCAAIIEQVTAAGVNDLACLLDFGLDYETTMEGLRHLAALRRDLLPQTATAVMGQGE